MFLNNWLFLKVVELIDCVPRRRWLYKTTVCSVEVSDSQISLSRSSKKENLRESRASGNERSIKTNIFSDGCTVERKVPLLALNESVYRIGGERPL